METLRIIYKRDYELQTRNFLSEEEKEEVINESKFIFTQVAEGIKEIETHNLEAIKGSIGYQVALQGYYFAIFITALLLCMILKRIVYSFI